MSGHSNSAVSRLVDRVFPIMPDFYNLINEQCDLALEAMEAFVIFMETGDPEKAEQVAALEHQADTIKERNIDILNKSFATPMDREDIYRAITRIDHILNYGKSTVREMEVLRQSPDKYMLEMAVFLRDGAEALQSGFKKLSTSPADAKQDAEAARKSERNTEKAYRRALAELFDPEDYIDKLKDKEQHIDASIQAMNHVVDIFKRREVYRHLSNAADRLARAGEVLHDIVVKIS